MERLRCCLQAPKPQQPPGEWQFLQCFGERQEGEEVHDGEEHRSSGVALTAHLLCFAGVGELY